MTCTCPKCDAFIEIDASKIPDGGHYIPCPQCKSRFWIGREAYSRRPLKKEGKIYCDSCGDEFTHPIVCTSCGAMYPDYRLVQAAKPAQRKIEQAEFSWNFSFRPARKTTFAYSEQRSGKSSKTLPVRAVAVLVVICLAAYGVLAYKRIKAEQEYSRNFFVVLYEMKTAADRSLKISAEWQAPAGGTTSGQVIPGQVRPEDASDLDTLNKEIGFVLEKIKDPPSKFHDINDKLLKLHATYAPLNAIILNPSGPLPGIATRVSKAESNYRQALQDLKVSLPADMAEDFKVAKTKYRGLQDI